LWVQLHGATSNADRALSYIRAQADPRGVLVFCPKSLERSWDLMTHHSFGADVTFINGALGVLFRLFNVDPKCLVIGGFSDGASYALSLGLLNGLLFSHIVAFSPGYFYAKTPRGAPAVFLTHGLHDKVLSVGLSRKIKLGLEKLGLSLKYTEFQGEHKVQDASVEEAMDFILSPRPREGDEKKRAVESEMQEERKELDMSAAL